MTNIEEAIRSKMKKLARLVEAELPRGTFFVVLAGTIGDRGFLQYISNARREDVAQLFREFLATAAPSDRTYAQDLTNANAQFPNENQEEFDTWLGSQIKRWPEFESLTKEMRMLLFDCWNASRSRQ